MVEMLGQAAGPVTPFDLERIVLGDASPWFLLEIVVRTLVMYGWTMLCVRFLGQRAVGQLTLIELVLVIGLGSAVGDPMFYPEVPLLHGMIVVMVVVGLDRAVTTLSSLSQRVETAIEGQPREVIRDGLIDRPSVLASQFNNDNLFELLRLKGITHLGEVRVAYWEQNGQLSVFRYRDASSERTGLAIEPPWDLSRPRRVVAGDATPSATRLGCTGCGTVRSFASGDLVPACDRCQAAEWIDAITDPPRPASPA